MKLFLRLPVQRPDLPAHFQRQGSNPVAVTAARLAFVSLVVPGLGLVSLGMGIVAWQRVNPDARPPIGNKRAAMTAVIFSVLATVLVGVDSLQALICLTQSRLRTTPIADRCCACLHHRARLPCRFTVSQSFDCFGNPTIRGDTLKTLSLSLSLSLL